MAASTRRQCDSTPANNPPPTTTPPTHPLPALILSIRNFFLLTLTSHRVTLSSVSAINVLLKYLSVPDKSLITNEEFVLSSTAMVVTLLGYYVLFGKRHRRKRKVLMEELREAQKQVHFLEDQLLTAKREDILASTPTRSSRSKREIRIFMDGAFDIMHYGHMNAFRLGRSLGTYLIVGVNSDESITQCKGPPLMNDKERLTMVQGCKFVDEVVPNCPYIMTSEYLEHIFNTYGVDYVVHGDDPCIVDGKDVYESAKRRGRYRSIPRTEGVSTTDIVGRMLLMTKDHHLRGGRTRANSVGSVLSLSGMGNSNTSITMNESFDEDSDDDSDNEIHNVDSNDETVGFGSPLGRQSKFLTTSMMLRLFSAGVKPPEEGMKVVYVDGAWDMFHCGHVEFLKAAKERGDYLIVGIHGDALVNRRRGGNLPLMNLHERVLSVLGCKYPDDVLIDAPAEITPDMIASLKITEVVHGTESDDSSSLADRYHYPKDMGILVSIKSPSDFTLSHIVSRIQKKQTELQSKIDRKKKAEREWFDNKYQPQVNGVKNGSGNGAKI
mmetsp:Transcript_3787/g.8339  ORF Transcript_3787/g.8339 Transcript_3787/m.8339 type:complete len:552 (-) Transcript_3787:75-1730(-)|eukprot:g7823.t1 g7823   contig26:361312-363481(+)